MASDRDALLLSIRPRFAELILAGEKTVELRRVRPRVIPGDKILMYASAPTMTLIGVAEVRDICDGAPRSVWRKLGRCTGISKAEFDIYFESAKKAVAIAIGKPRYLSKPITLPNLRDLFDGFQPPQSFRYLSRSDLRTLGVSF